MINQSEKTEIAKLSTCESNKYYGENLPNNTDEINLLEYIYAIVKNKWWIIGFTLLGIASGYIIALSVGPVFFTEAVISAKENENTTVPNLSGLGAFGGLVASQLSIGGNPGLGKIELILGSRKFNAEMIEKYELLPLIFKNQYPKEYRKWYDTTRNEWKSEFNKPNNLAIGAGLRNYFLKSEVNKNNTMTIRVESKDSTFSDILLSSYLQYLNIFIQNSVQTEARENVSYLEKQLVTIADPLLREKLQGLIASELEKEMLVSKEAFIIVDPPLRTLNFKKKISLPMVMGCGLMFFTVLIIVVSHAIVSVPKTQQNIELIRKIKKGLFF